MNWSERLIARHSVVDGTDHHYALLAVSIQTARWSDCSRSILVGGRRYPQIKEIALNVTFALFGPYMSVPAKQKLGTYMRLRIFTPLAALVAIAMTSSTYADTTRQYEVTITNITRGQTFTPQLVVTHQRSVSLFELGMPASLGLEILAEGGDTGMLSGELGALGDAVGSVQTVPGLLGPGQSVTVTVAVSNHHRFLSFAAMLIPTNDTFAGLNGLRLPRHGAVSVTVQAYDAGTEQNDQNCLNIPGPRCGGEGYSPGPNVGDEEYIYISNGFHSLAPAEAGEVLGPQVYDWRNPVAQISVKRI